MTTDERKFVLTALEMLRDLHGWCKCREDMHPEEHKRIEAAIKALEIALGL